MSDAAKSFYDSEDGEHIFVPDEKTPEQVQADIDASFEPRPKPDLDPVIPDEIDDEPLADWEKKLNDGEVEEGRELLIQALADKKAADERQAEADLEELDFEHQLAALINRHSAENESGTPDYILAEYMLRCLVNFNETVKARAIWRGEDVRLHGDIHNL